MKNLIALLSLTLFASVSFAQLSDFERGYRAGVATCSNNGGGRLYSCTFARLGQCYQKTGYGNTLEEARREVIRLSREGDVYQNDCGYQAASSAVCQAID